MTSVLRPRRSRTLTAVMALYLLYTLIPLAWLVISATKTQPDLLSTPGLSFGGVPATLHVPFAAVTQFHDPAVEFALTFQTNAAEEPHDEHEEAENDVPSAEKADDGSNVVSVDFTRKK